MEQIYRGSIKFLRKFVPPPIKSPEEGSYIPQEIYSTRPIFPGIKMSNVQWQTLCTYIMVRIKVQKEVRARVRMASRSQENNRKMPASKKKCLLLSLKKKVTFGEDKDNVSAKDDCCPHWSFLTEPEEMKLGEKSQL